ncbi:MAG: Uma2 family endonuclease [Candidatus Competibacteraceae bacterium]|nr:Uma2 family endonuclease [Candidatus Competibacteraceae bacterium]
MQWSQVLEDPTLQNLPYKIELNEWGNIVLSPASNRHGLLQAELAGLLREQKTQGKVLTECSIDTFKGVKVADLAWGSTAFFQHNGVNTPYPEAPELCIESLSPSNSQGEMEQKIQLYLAKGAREVWLCSEQGALEFYGYRGPLERSELFPAMPLRADI